MMERSIELTEIKQAIAKGEVIEDYPDDYPYPSCLILAKSREINAEMQAKTPKLRFRHF